MIHTKSKINAILEVIAVFLLIFIIIWAMQVSPFGEWKNRVLQQPFPEYALMIIIPLILLISARRDLVSYGISFSNPRYHFNIVVSCFLPVGVASVAFAFVDYTRWDGALVFAAIRIALLFALAWLLRSKASAGNIGIVSAFLLLLSGNPLLMVQHDIGRALSGFLFYLVFVGFGEEILFRGYIQSRLNHAFGRPFKFFKVHWGWGVIITSMMFGFMHVLNPFNPFFGAYGLLWWWGFWTFFSGLVYGFIREKTGSILAPAILHGLPQAIAYLIISL